MKEHTLLETTGISLAPIGVYDVADPEPFAPFTSPGPCIFSAFEAWQSNRSTVITSDNATEHGCPGAAYWMCGIAGMPTRATAEYLAGEGLKASTEIMCRWLRSNRPRPMENSAVVISRLREDQYESLLTVTFFVTPDQLALLLTGAEYLHAGPGSGHVTAPYSSGCGQLMAMFPDLGQPAAMIGGTDIAQRKYLPPDILAFTVTRPMLEQLCTLDEQSFLHKRFWQELRAVRQPT